MRDGHLLVLKGAVVRVAFNEEQLIKYAL